MKEACRIIINDIIEGKISTRRDLEVKKRQLCRDLKLSRFMSNADILEYATDEEKKLVSDTLKKKPTRTKSGVAIVAVMCHPHKCTHGRCLYCPESDIAPPSYTGEEPAALRGRMFKYHPYVQCFNRLSQLKKIGHRIDNNGRNISFKRHLLSGMVCIAMPKGHDRFRINFGKQSRV